MSYRLFTGLSSALFGSLNAAYTSPSTFSMNNTSTHNRGLSDGLKYLDHFAFINKFYVNCFVGAFFGGVLGFCTHRILYLARPYSRLLLHYIK